LAELFVDWIPNILRGNQFMYQLASASSALPSRVQAYVETIVHTCADDGQGLVSLVVLRNLHGHNVQALGFEQWQVTEPGGAGGE
jgi:hypothetical protein